MASSSSSSSARIGKETEADSSEDFVVPQLRQLDQSFRCPICLSHFTAPLSLNCGHTFCSQCVRSYLAANAKCPSCLESTDSSKLRKVPALGEAVQAWVDAREHLLRQNNPKNIPKPPVTPSKRARMEDTESEQDPDFEILDNGIEPDPSAMVQCPICEGKLKYRDLNPHVDVCTGDKQALEKSKKAAATWTAIMKGSPSKSKSNSEPQQQQQKRLHMPADYNMRGRKEIVKMLKEQNVPYESDESINALRARHRQFVVLNNANLDLAQPKSHGTIIKQLEDWVRAQKSKSSSINLQEHHDKYRSDFARMIAEVRQRNKQKGKASDVELEQNNDDQTNHNDEQDEQKPNKGIIGESQEEEEEEEGEDNDDDDDIKILNKPLDLEPDPDPKEESQLNEEDEYTLLEDEQFNNSKFNTSQRAQSPFNPEGPALSQIRRITPV